MRKIAFAIREKGLCYKEKNSGGTNILGWECAFFSQLFCRKTEKQYFCTCGICGEQEMLKHITVRIRHVRFNG